MIGARVQLPLLSADGRKTVFEINLERYQTLHSHAVNWTSEQCIQIDRQKTSGASPRCELRDFRLCMSRN